MISAPRKLKTIAPPTPTQRRGLAISEYFGQCLGIYPEAQNYLESRGLPREAQIQLGVGFCPPHFEHWFPLLRGRIVVPIRDCHGKVVAFAGRIFEPMRADAELAVYEAYEYKPLLAEEQVAKWRKGKWINENFPKSRHLFNLDRAKNAVRESDFVVVVEGYMDALVMAWHGTPNTVATCGVSLSEYHAALIARYCSRAMIMLDPDEAGEKGVVAATATLDRAKIAASNLVLPEGMDPDDLVVKKGGPWVNAVINDMISRGITERTLKSSGTAKAQENI